METWQAVAITMVIAGSPMFIIGALLGRRAAFREKKRIARFWTDIQIIAERNEIIRRLSRTLEFAGVGRLSVIPSQDSTGIDIVFEEFRRDENQNRERMQ